MSREGDAGGRVLALTGSGRHGVWLIAALLVPLAALAPAVAHAQRYPALLSIPPLADELPQRLRQRHPARERGAYQRGRAAGTASLSPGGNRDRDARGHWRSSAGRFAWTIFANGAWGKQGNRGDTARNAGAVILLVPKETSSDGRGHCFVTTGNATEGFITDADAGDMCRAAIPYFRKQNYGAVGLSSSPIPRRSAFRQ